MSSSGSASSSSDLSENEIYDLEVDDRVLAASKGSNTENDHAIFSAPYEGEPLASEGWQESYARELEENEERLSNLRMRLDGSKALDEWCTCGYCNTELLQNAYECLCCHEIDRCVEALNKEEVLLEVSKVPSCITRHPGFTPICLDRWSLRHAASKLRTRERKLYTQTKSEETFLRSIAYREFTHFIHGRLGRLRYSLPSCAYYEIRKQFMAPEGETFVGYEEESSDE